MGMLCSDPLAIAHVLTSTRKLEPKGLTAKTRVLDPGKTGGVEIEPMRGVWGHLQDRILDQAGGRERFDQRSVEAQREAALERGDELPAEELDGDPETKPGPAANSMERRAKVMAERPGREYVPVVALSSMPPAMPAQLSAKCANAWASRGRHTGPSLTRGGAASLSSRGAPDLSGDCNPDNVCERLARVLGRLQDDVTPKPEGRNSARERMKEIMEKDAAHEGQAAVHQLNGHSVYDMGRRLRMQRAPTHRQGQDRSADIGRDGSMPSVNEPVKDILNKPRDRLKIMGERGQERDENEKENTRNVVPGEGQSQWLS